MVKIHIKKVKSCIDISISCNKKSLGFSIKAKKLIIRVPVIPTFNDTPEEIISIANFAKSLGTVTELHLLPYHRLGYDKYVGLSREYKMGDIPVPSKEHMEILRSAAMASGLDIIIGG